MGKFSKTSLNSDDNSLGGVFNISLKKKKKEPGGFQIVLSSPFKEIKSLGGDE